MSARPRLLDLCCCEGGAAMGYHQAGFDVVGVDIVERKRFPFEFVQADAVEYAREHADEFDAIHASPPCQAHTAARAMGGNKEHACIIDPLREVLRASGKPYVIENVPGSPLVGARLCGTSFGLPVRRHRLFETSFFMMTPECLCKHPAGDFPGLVTGQRSGFVQVCGNARRAGELDLRRRAMEMPWASDKGVSQAIPPAFTRYIGERLMEVVTRRQGMAA